MGSKPDIFPLFHLTLWEYSFCCQAVFLNTFFVSKEFIAFLEYFIIY